MPFSEDSLQTLATRGIRKSKTLLVVHMAACFKAEGMLQKMCSWLRVIGAEKDAPKTKRSALAKEGLEVQLAALVEESLYHPTEGVEGGAGAVDTGEAKTPQHQHHRKQPPEALTSTQEQPLRRQTETETRDLRRGSFYAARDGARQQSYELDAKGWADSHQREAADQAPPLPQQQRNAAE